jgi:hypothetical protein
LVASEFITTIRQFSKFLLFCANFVIASLAWAEMSTILSKLYFMYDLELISKDVDWHRDSLMATLWVKPELRVRVKPAVRT